MPSRLLGLAAVSTLAVFSALALAQEPDPGHGTQTLHTGTQLVIIDATIYDKQHNVVTSPLTRDDFQVTEDNAPQDIRYFESESDHQAAAAKGEAPLLIAILDELNFPYNGTVTNGVNIAQQNNDYTYLRTQLLHWLQSQPEQLHGPMKIFALTHNGLLVVQQSTRDRKQLIDSISHRNPGLGSPYRNYLEDIQGDNTLKEDSLKAMWTLGLEERSEPDRKIVVWLGWGTPNIVDNPLAISRRDKAPTPFEITVRRICNLLVDARITLNVFTPGIISAGTSRPSGYGKAMDYYISAYTAEIGLSSYSKLTGGNVLTGNNVQGEVAEASNSSTRFYTLSYTPRSHIEDASFRSVHVTVKGHPEWTVATKTGYYAVGIRDDRDKERELLNDMAMAAFEPMPFSHIGLELIKVERLPAAPNDKAQLARFTLQAGSDDLQWSADSSTGLRYATVNLSASALDNKTNTLASREGEFALSSHADIKEHIRSEVSIIAPVPEKTNHIRFVMRDTANGRLGTLDVKSAVLKNATLYTPPTPALQARPPADTPSTNP